MSYVLPTSLSWWVGLVALILGTGSLVAGQYAPEAVEHLDFARYLFVVLFGWSDPSALGLILGGSATIGLRAKLERTLPEA